MKRFLILTAAVLAAVFICDVATLPPKRITLAALPDGTVAGILHIHTNRSDGLSSPDEVAAAAARAGLAFIVFTDHGDATRPPDPPAYRSGVLCLDGIEISTTGGHYIAVDMPAAPYPLGGEARDVVEDVRRLGGFGIVAHPDSPKAQLRWIDWTAPFDAVELLNPDSSWRILADRGGIAPKWRLLSALFHYPFRAPETIVRLIQPTGVLEQWAVVAQHRRVVAIAGADAHARIALRNTDPENGTPTLPLPGYETSFRVMSVRARIDRPFSGAAASDAAVLMRALRNGHLYMAVDAIASPPALWLTATNDHGTVHEGDVLGAGDAVQLRVQTNAPPGFTTIVHDGARTLSAVPNAEDLTVHGPSGPGVYWAEVVSNVGSPPVTWIRSNPIYVRAPVDTPPPAVLPDAVMFRTLFSRETPARLELSKASGAIEPLGVDDGALRLRATLEGGAPTNQTVALVFDTPAGVAGFDRALVRLRSDRPMRMSVQLRAATGVAAGDRWIRSVYADGAWRDYALPFTEFVPAGTTHVPRPPLDDIRSVMLVVDLTNTKPGFSGTISVETAALAR